MWEWRSRLVAKFHESLEAVMSQLGIQSQKVTTQPMWWCAARTTTLFSHFRPREARAKMAVSSKPE
jgi:uncharacterized protein YbaP (TraB family)